jgi:glutamate formiminotransferase
MIGKDYCMRNQEWGTAQPILPDHLRSEFDEINEEVRVACEQMDAAHNRHAAAILARIEMATEAIDQELHAASEQIDLVSKHYVDVIEKRIAITDKINAFIREQDHRQMAG